MTYICDHLYEDQLPTIDFHQPHTSQRLVDEFDALVGVLGRAFAGVR